MLIGGAGDIAAQYLIRDRIDILFLLLSTRIQRV